MCSADCPSVYDTPEYANSEIYYVKLCHSGCSHRWCINSSTLIIYLQNLTFFLTLWSEKCEVAWIIYMFFKVPFQLTSVTHLSWLILIWLRSDKIIICHYENDYLKANKLFEFLQLKKIQKIQSKSCVNRKLILLKTILVIRFPGPHLSLLPPELDFKRGRDLIDASLSSYLIYFWPGNSSSKKTFTCFSVITHLPKDKEKKNSDIVTKTNIILLDPAEYFKKR